MVKRIMGVTPLKLESGAARPSRAANTDIRRLVRQFIPEIVFTVARRLRGPEWEHVGRDWPSADPRAAGWDDPSVALHLRNKWDAYSRIVASASPLGLRPWSPEVFDTVAHTEIMTFAYVLTRAAHRKERLSVLDWGGALGHYALIGKRLLPDVSLDYTVKDHPRLCDVGHALMPDVKFTPSDDECFERRYDVVIASSSLQYAENWLQVAQRLAHSANEWLLVTSLPVVRESPGFVISHRAHRHGLRTEYLAWVLNAGDLVTSISDEGFDLERELLLGQLRVPRVREDIAFAGFLFRRTEQPLAPKAHG